MRSTMKLIFALVPLLATATMLRADEIVEGQVAGEGAINMDSLDNGIGECNDNSRISLHYNIPISTFLINNRGVH